MGGWRGLHHRSAPRGFPGIPGVFPGFVILVPPIVFPAIVFPTLLGAACATAVALIKARMLPNRTILVFIFVSCAPNVTVVPATFLAPGHGTHPLSPDYGAKPHETLARHRRRFLLLPSTMAATAATAVTTAATAMAAAPAKAVTVAVAAIVQIAAVIQPAPKDSANNRGGNRVSSSNLNDFRVWARQYRIGQANRAG